MRRTAAFTAALVVALGTGLGIGHWATAARAIEAATFRSVDMTLICTTAGPAGYRTIEATTAPRNVTPTFDFPGSMGVTTGGGLSPPLLASAAARGTSGRDTGAILIHRTRCSTTAARIPLTRQGLPGPAIEYQKQAECPAPRRVIVRLRATLASAGPWQVVGRRREYRGIRRNVVSAAIAVRSWPRRKPLALVTLDARESTRLWSGSNCS